jgi:ketosteroid isomerase-like protein
VEQAELAKRFLAALSDGDCEGLGELVHPEVEIRTERTVHCGREAAVQWSGKVFDHLQRRYVPREIEQTPAGLLVHAELQYVWRETGDVGDTSRVAIELGVRDGLISSWYLLDEPDSRDATERG